MLPAKTASSSQSMDARSHPTRFAFTESDITNIREAVGRLPPYPKTDEPATDRDLKETHRLLRTMVMYALMNPECVPAMYEAYLNKLKEKGPIIGPNLEAESKSPRGSQTSVPTQNHSKCEKSKGGPSVQKGSPQCVGGAKASPCPTRGQQSSSKPQHRADQSQKESKTQQQQPQTKTDGKTAVETKARADPWAEERERDCGPVSPGVMLQLCDAEPPIEEGNLQAHRLIFHIPSGGSGGVTLRIITWTQYIEHVAVGDRLRVRSVTLSKKGGHLMYQLVKRFGDKDLHFDVRFVEAQVLEPAGPDPLPLDDDGDPVYQ